MSHGLGISARHKTEPLTSWSSIKEKFNVNVDDCCVENERRVKWFCRPWVELAIFIGVVKEGLPTRVTFKGRTEKVRVNTRHTFGGEAHRKQQAWQVQGRARGQAGWGIGRKRESVRAEPRNHLYHRQRPAATK